MTVLQVKFDAVLKEEATFSVPTFSILEIHLQRYGQKSQPFVDAFKWLIVKDQERTVLSVTKELFVEFNSNVQKLRNSQKSAKIPRKGRKF